MIIIKVLITITTATTTIMIIIIIIIIIILIIITNRYSKLTRSSYRYYFPYCFFPLNKMLFNSVFVCIDIVCCFQEIRQFINTRCHIWTNFLSLIDFPQCLAWFKKELLVVALFWSTSLNTSFIYRELKKLKNLKITELIHCLNRSFMGSQFIFSNLDKPIWPTTK